MSDSPTLTREVAAEQHVIAALRKLHFSVVKRSDVKSDPTTVEAWSGTQHIFLGVEAAIAPAEPAALRPERRRELKERAARAQGEAWEARVVMNADLELARLDWWPLEEMEACE